MGAFHHGHNGVPGVLWTFFTNSAESTSHSLLKRHFERRRALLRASVEGVWFASGEICLRATRSRSLIVKALLVVTILAKVLRASAVGTAVEGDASP